VNWELETGDGKWKMVKGKARDRTGIPGIDLGATGA